MMYSAILQDRNPTIDLNVDDNKNELVALFEKAYSNFCNTIKTDNYSLTITKSFTKLKDILIPTYNGKFLIEDIEIPFQCYDKMDIKIWINLFLKDIMIQYNKLKDKSIESESIERLLNDIEDVFKLKKEDK